MLSEDEILNALSPILEDYAQNKGEDEHFGDFVIRKEYIKATLEGKHFHA
jgi:sulfite reductase (NADPH) hemoprotein beta-component